MNRHLPAVIAVLVAIHIQHAQAAAPPDQGGIAAIPGLSAWYRGDSVTQGIGGALTALNDCSGKGRAISAGAKPPTVVANGANGKPVLRFGGGETPLVNEQCNWSAAGFTVFIVASYDDIAPKPIIRDNPTYIIDTPGKALVSDGGSAGLALGLNWNGRPGMAGGINQPDPQTAFDPPYPNDQASDLVIKPRTSYAFAYSSAEGKNNPKANAWDCRLKVSVSANDTASSTVPTPFVSMQAMNGGKKLQIGAAGTREAFKGDIAEVIVFNAELSAENRGTVLSYLRDKYDLHEVIRRVPASAVAITPTFDGGTFWFRDSVTVRMSTATAGGEIHYATNGASPSQTSPLYSAPVTLTASETIKAQAFAAGRDSSPVTTARFVKIADPPPTANKLNGGWKYSWGDEFDGPAVNESLWGHEIGYIRNSEAQYYSKRTENSRIDNGNLLIQGRYDNWDGHKYTSASRSTEKNVTLTYGRYEIRAKIDTRSGSWPAWWIWSRPDGAGWPKEGEIDMMEYCRGKCLFNVVDGRGQFDTHTRRLNTLGGDRWATFFHIWTMDWDADKIDLYLDGTLMCHYPVDKANGTGPNGANPYRNPQTKKMILNQALGGSCGGPLKASDAPFEFRVDWLRVHTWADQPAYTLTVNGGVGTGPYVTGTKASITANMPPAGYVFDKWVIAGNAAIDAPTSASATLVMPTSDVTVTATYLAQ